MPKRKKGKTKGKRTIKAGVKGNRIKRGGPTLSMANSVARGASSVAKNTFGKPMKRPRSGNRLDRSVALRSMAGTMASGMSSLGRSAYSKGMPMIEEAGRSIGKSISKAISEYRVPTVNNNATWVDLKKGLEKGLINLGLLDDEEIDPAIYFQSVERFLDIHKKAEINKVSERARDHINRVKDSFRAMPGMPGDPAPVIMKRIFENGITKDNIVSALEYAFHEILVEDLDMDISTQSTPGSGFQVAREKTAKKQKMAKIVNLSRGIEILLGTDDKLGHYKSTIEEKFMELQDLVTTDQELKILKILVKKYPQLNSMMPAALKKQMKGEKRTHKKKGTHKKKRPKRTCQRSRKRTGQKKKDRQMRGGNKYEDNPEYSFRNANGGSGILAQPTGKYLIERNADEWVTIDSTLAEALIEAYKPHNITKRKELIAKAVQDYKGKEASSASSSSAGGSSGETSASSSSGGDSSKDKYGVADIMFASSDSEED